MVIGSSALIAIMSNEAARRLFEQCIRMAATRLLGAASLAETSIVVLSPPKGDLTAGVGWV